MDISLKRITEIFSRFKKARIFLAAAVMVFAAVCTGINGYHSKSSYNYINMTDYDSGSDSELTSREIQIDIRNKMYYDLCVLGSLYLSNCEDGRFIESSSVYEGIYGCLNKTAYTSDEASSVISISQSNWKINTIDSDYYYFYVSYGDEYLTNISGVTESLSDVSALLDKASFDGCDYYIRQNNEFTIDTNINESGLGNTEVYYTALDTDGNETLTSEYIDSSELIKGYAMKSCEKYSFCFSGGGDETIYTIDEDDRYFDPSEFLYDTANIYDGYLGDIILQDDNTLLINCYSYDYDEETEKYSCSISIDPSSEYYYPILYTCSVYDTDGYYVDYYDLVNSGFEAIDLSELKIFMSPKFDIAGEYMTNITTVKTSYIVSSAVYIASKTLFAICLLLFAAITFSAAEGELANERGLIMKLPEKADKLDLNILITLTGSALFSILKKHSHYLYDYSTARLASRSILYAVLSLPAAYLICCGLSGAIRLLKEKGVKRSASESFINIVVHESAPYRKKAAEKLSPVTRKLSVKTSKRRLQLLCAVISLLFMTLSVIFYDCDFYYGAFAIAIIAQTAIILAVLYVFVIRNVTKLERKLMIMTDEELKDVKKPKIRKMSAFYPISRRLDEISEATERAVQNSVKSERTKVELVTNVSHDLKTPLASIISYIDLLEKSELSDEAQSYVKILERKADKLSDIVADVFVMAKAVSGVEVASEELDFTILVTQVLADNSVNVECSGRKLCAEIEPKTSPICGDGAKLSRVVQNLLDNALKYSLDGTRVFLRLTETADRYKLIVKNVSAYEMNFSTDEIVERFTRGDKSRTDGGSGLGLAIAKSFTEACGGAFAVEIDGDVFIAKMTMPKRMTRENGGGTGGGEGSEES